MALCWLHSNSCHTTLHSWTSRSFSSSAPAPSPCFCFFLSTVCHWALSVFPQLGLSLSLALFIELNISLPLHPSFLSEKGFVEALPPCPTSGPSTLSPLPPLSALNMSLQSAAKSYKQALNYNKTMAALLSNGSVLSDCVYIRNCVYLWATVDAHAVHPCLRLEGWGVSHFLPWADWFANSLSPSC